jgi:hypothetical protein
MRVAGACKPCCPCPCSAIFGHEDGNVCFLVQRKALYQMTHDKS